MSLKFLTVQLAVIQAAVSKPDRIITATDVFDVVAQQCHEGGYQVIRGSSRSFVIEQLT